MKTKNIRKLYLILLSVILFTSCHQTNKTIKGELFFKIIDFSPATGMKKDDIKKMERIIETIDKVGNSKNDKLFVNYFNTLKKHNLLHSPFIKIKTDTIIRKVFITHQEYQKISAYTLNDLQQQNKKVEIELVVKELEKDLFFSDEIINIKKVDGKTPWQK